MTSRSAAARQLGVTRDRLAGWERDGLAHVERDERGQPSYSDAEIGRLAAALRTGALTAPPRGAQTRSTRHLALVPAAQLDTQAVAVEDAIMHVPDPQFTQVHAQPLVRTAQSVLAAVAEHDDPEVAAKLVAAQRSRAEVQRLAAEVDELRARAEHAEVVRALALQQRSRRVDEIAAHAIANVPDEADRDLAEQLVRQQLGGVVDLGDWQAVAVAVRDGVETARARGEAARCAAAERAAEFQRVAALRAAQAAAAQAARTAEAAEAQRVSAAHAQAAAHAQQQRAQSIADAIASEASAQGVPPTIVEAAGRGAWNALVQLGATVDYNTAFHYARAAGLQAAAMAWPSDYGDDWDGHGRRRR